MRVAAIVVMVEYVAAYLVGVATGFAYPFPMGTFVPTALIVTVFMVCGFSAAKLAKFAIEREPNPIKRLSREVWRKPDIPVGIFLTIAQMVVLAWAKVTLPFAVDFWADPALADLDRTLFLSREPWRVTHALLGWASPLLDRAYVAWGPVNLTLVALLLMLPESSRRSQSLAAFFLVLAISATSMFLLPSGGPIFFEKLGYGLRFADMPVLPWVETTSNYLWRGHVSPDDRLGAGISAMPSVHVGIALWVALVSRAYQPRLQMIGWAFFATILVGSVHLGWHYAVDGLASIAIAGLAWRLAARLTRAAPQTVGPEPRAYSPAL